MLRADCRYGCELMDEILWFIVITYLLAGLFQGIIISIYENWYDGYTAPGEQIIYYLMFMVGWPILWMIELIDLFHYPL
jgi:hypothetical protein